MGGDNTDLDMRINKIYFANREVEGKALLEIKINTNRCRCGH